MRAVLVVGVPRSATTWVQYVLSKTAGARSVYEPDNESLHAAAMHAKRELGRFPILAPGDAVQAYERIWARALSGRRHTDSLAGKVARVLFEGSDARERQRLAASGPRLRAATFASRFEPVGRPREGAMPIVKSVHAAFALEWIAERWDPQIVIVHRDPLNVLASWLELGLADAERDLDRHPRIGRILDEIGARPPTSGAGPLERSAWQLGLLTGWLSLVATRHPDRVVVRHEELCVDPPARFRALCDSLGLEWTPRAARFLRRSDRPGEGYELRRVASAQADRWRDRLTPAQVAEIRRGLAPFGAPIVSEEALG